MKTNTKIYLFLGGLLLTSMTLHYFGMLKKEEEKRKKKQQIEMVKNEITWYVMNDIFFSYIAEYVTYETNGDSVYVTLENPSPHKKIKLIFLDKYFVYGLINDSLRVEDINKEMQGCLLWSEHYKRGNIGWETNKGK